MKKLGVILVVLLGLGLLFNSFYSAKASGPEKNHFVDNRDDGGFNCLHGGLLACERQPENNAGVE